MADSKDKTQAGTETPPEVTTAITMVRRGATIVQNKDSHGKFLKIDKPLPPVKEFNRAERKFLLKARESGLTEYMEMFMNMVKIAQYDGDDAKLRMAAVQAFEKVTLRALGKPAPSEVEMDKLTQQAVRVVVIQPPTLPTEVEDGDKPKPENKQPAFAEVVGIKNN